MIRVADSAYTCTFIHLFKLKRFGLMFIHVLYIIVTGLQQTNKSSHHFYNNLYNHSNTEHI